MSFKELDEKDVKMIVEYWILNSDEDFNTMNQLFISHSFNWSLFLAHISIEKLLKAFYVKIHKTHAPKIHNLYRLAELSKIDLSEEYSDWLDTITSFNINARYDDYKREFFNLCTADFTKLWISRVEELREWIKKKL